MYAKIHVLTNSLESNLSCFGIHKITDSLLNKTIHKILVSLPTSIVLVDPDSNIDPTFDIIIEANCFLSLLNASEIKINKNELIGIIQNWVGFFPVLFIHEILQCFVDSAQNRTTI